MRICVWLFIFFITACKLPEDKEDPIVSGSDTTSMEVNETNNALQEESDTVQSIHPVQKLKNPKGIYQTVLSADKKLEQTIAFNADLTYQLQEKYTEGKKDSLVITQGNWLPSDGFIWIYKDQVVRGRYKWNGETLQYFSPQTKKTFDMHQLNDILDNNAWRNKPNTGITVFGVGNEPFWSVEVGKTDSVSFLLSEWTRPMTLKITSTIRSADSVAYVAGSDSAQLKLTIYPVFCSDGMSDFTYRNKVRVQFNDQIFHGCGMVYGK